MEELTKDLEDLDFKVSDAIAILQDILNTEHTNTEQKRIKHMNNRSNCACPICGDSSDDKYKKRGNLYHKNLFFKCYNCDWRGSILQLLNQFDMKIDPKMKLDMVEYVSAVMDRVKFDEDEFISNSLDKLLDLEQLTNYFNTDKKSQITNFKPVEKGSEVYKYLIGRKIFNHTNIYEGTFWITPTWKEAVMINMNMAGSKVIGIQTRNLRSRDQRRFKVYKFSELWDLLNPEKPLDDIEAIGYDKLSYLYGIMDVDWSRPITVFEGYLDTKFCPNSIGCVGTNTDLGLLLTQEAFIRFFYDHDKTGIKKAKEQVSKGFSVFLWDKLFLDWSKTRPNSNKAYRKLVSEIVDLNQVGTIVKNPYKTLDLEEYFSFDEFDIIHIKDIYDE